MDDPFSCFGSDSDDDDDDDNHDHDAAQQMSDLVTSTGELLKNRYNSQENNIDHDHHTTTSITETPTNLTTELQSHTTSNLNDELPPPITYPWTHTPMYIGPIQITSTNTNINTNDDNNDNPDSKSAIVGGYRKVIATRDLNPGTLLLLEKPIYTWSSEQIGKELNLSSVLDIIHKSQEQFRTKVKGDENENEDENDARDTDILHHLEYLHPTKELFDTIMNEPSDNNNSNSNNIHPMDYIQIKDMVEILRLMYQDSKQLQQILNYITKEEIHPDADEGNQINQNQQSIRHENDIYRILLALRYNGFTSGVYLFFSMFNHDDNPNCIKYMPPSEHGPNSTNVNSSGTSPGSRGTNSSNHDRKFREYSEVRTTRFVKRGEELTLHYMEPREISHATRRWYLWDQHRFDIGDESQFHHSRIIHSNGSQEINKIHPTLYDMELVNGQFPHSSTQRQNSKVQESSVTYRIEKSLDELEVMQKELESTWKSLVDELKQRNNGVGVSHHQVLLEGCVQVFERAKAMEITSHELIRASIDQMANEVHLLLIRCYTLHIDSCALVLRINEEGKEFKNTLNSSEDTTESNNSHILHLTTSKQENNLLCRFVESSRKLLTLQIPYYGNHHPNIARTYLDLANTLRQLLSICPKQLIQLKLEDMKSFNECSKFENKCRLEFKRIDGLYSENMK